MNEDEKRKPEINRGYLVRTNISEQQEISDGECTDCLDLKKVFISSPKIVVWSALEEAAKQRSAQQARRHPHRKTNKKDESKPKRFIWLFLLGCVLITVGILTFVWKPFDILMTERLKMMKGLPAYEWWQNPPDEVLLRAYVFNITNGNEFMRGEANKLIVQEVGPYIFREKLYHTNVSFNDNGTLTYTATRKLIYLPEMNTLSLNDTVIVANLAVMGVASYLSNAPYFTKLAFNLFINRFGTKPFVRLSVNDYFWNFTDPLLMFGRSFAPSLVPEDNMGILNQVYKDFTDVVTVQMGVESGPRNFFKISKYNGANGLQAWDNETCDSVEGSSEGVSYHQNVFKNDTVKYLRKTICRALPLYYGGDVEMYGMIGYRFNLPNNSFSRPENENEECYREPGYPLLPSGLSDVSPCYYNLPIASSFPHLMYAEPKAIEKLEGLTPDWDKHGSAAIIEPNTGVPFTAWARSQSNLIMHSMSGFPKLKRFSNMAIPMFWLEYKQMGLPNYISTLMYFSVVILPSIQIYISLSLLIIGFIFYLISMVRMWKSVSYKGAKYSIIKLFYSSRNETTECV